MMGFPFEAGILSGLQVCRQGALASISIWSEGTAGQSEKRFTVRQAQEDDTTLADLGRGHRPYQGGACSDAGRASRVVEQIWNNDATAKGVMLDAVIKFFDRPGAKDDPTCLVWTWSRIV